MTISSATPPAPMTSAAPGYQSQRLQVGLQEDPEPAARYAGQVDRGGAEYPQGGGRGHHRLPRDEALPIREVARVEVGRDGDLGQTAGLSSAALRSPFRVVAISRPPNQSWSTSG